MTLDILYPATYDATSLNTDSGGQHRLMIGLVRGLDDLPEVRGRDTVIPGTAGRTHRTRVRDYRVIELGGWVFGVGATDAAQRSDMRAALNSLQTLFDPTKAPATLSVTLEDATVASISCRPVNMLWVEMPDVTARRVSIELEAVGADWNIV